MLERVTELAPEDSDTGSEEERDAEEDAVQNAFSEELGRGLDFRFAELASEYDRCRSAWFLRA